MANNSYSGNKSAGGFLTAKQSPTGRASPKAHGLRAPATMILSQATHKDQSHEDF